MDRVNVFLGTEFPDGEERALLLAIAASPTDKTTKLVYADWLDERSDPRAEYVRSLVKKGRRKPTARMTVLQLACSGTWLSVLGVLHPLFDEVVRKVEGRVDPTRGRQPRFQDGSGDTPGWRETLFVSFHRGLWDFQYEGNLWLEEDGLSPVLDFVCQPHIASVLRNIWLNAYADHPRTNGTLHLALGPMTSGRVTFPYLEGVGIEQSQNTVLGRGGYEEDGETARLLGACPRLKSLTVPSAPNAAFFSGSAHPLEALSVHAGYNTEGFVTNLAASRRFGRLRSLRYKDFCCEYMAPEPHMLTPFRDWKALFRSPVFEALETVELSGVVLTEEEVRALLKIRSTGVTIQRSPAAP
jgi:uncharacterized protein (TIGR02996 family)